MATQSEWIDLRSDTVTKPTPGMRRAMTRAEVGDDVYGEDPTVRELEVRIAELLGKPAALFTPSGSMANLLGVQSLVAPGEEVLCEANAHLARAELGAHGAISGVTMRTWQDPHGGLKVSDLETIFAPRVSPYFVATAAISLENTHNFAGGTVLTLVELEAVADFAKENTIGVHLDGARLWHAQVATGSSVSSYAGCADVVSVCLSKGLGAPIGSLVVGSSEMVANARILRKRLGGGMRQVGVLAAAGLYALEHHLDRLVEDHSHAQLIAKACAVPEPETNIVVLEVGHAASFVQEAAKEGILVGVMDPRTIRLVTHLDVSQENAQYAAAALARCLKLFRQ
jgi:threonine aldolase